MYACMEGHFEIVRWLLASNQVDTEQVNAKDNVKYLNLFHQIR